MDAYDVLIVGAGPAGSSCAWKLRNSGLTILILDKNRFPRDKVCGGWITPAVIQELDINLAEYACGRVLQPIHGFRISRMGGREVETNYRKPISYGIRRCEFDDFLLKRSGAQVQEGMPLTKLERSGGHWIANGEFRAGIVVGAGGHFCPVARYRGANARSEVGVAAQEIEFEMSESQQNQCAIRPQFPELYFCSDMKGYGWCVRKKNFLNVGLGRLDSHALPRHVANFVEFLNKKGKVTFDLPLAMCGHSYLLYGYSKRKLADDGVLLTGDAAGLAYSQSGEGIRPAIESGLMAAKAILTLGRSTDSKVCEMYRSSLAARFGKSQWEWTFRIGKLLPTPLVSFLSRLLVANRWFSRHVILERWFLHVDEAALRS